MAFPTVPKTLAQAALVPVGVLWAGGGVFLYSFIRPTKMEDGTYWDLIDPISVERATSLQRQALLVGMVGLGVAAFHLAMAILWRKTAWRRWAGAILGGLYCASAIPLFVTAMRQPSSALPVYTVVASVMGVLLLMGSRWMPAGT